MVDDRAVIASSEQLRQRMQRQRQRDTKPELAIRRVLHARGYRYRVDYPIPGSRAKADVAFTRLRIAIFVDGCFWHQCPAHGTLPKRNRKWWKAKLAANVRRDAEIDKHLGSCGWTVLRIWEHDPPSAAVARIESLVHGMQTTR